MITLPESVAARATEIHPPVATRTAPGSRCHVLLVDDDEPVGSLVGIYLRRTGWNVTHFTSVAAARRWLGEHRCDLVITDILMPESDGLEFIQWLRGRNPDTRIIAISGTDAWGNCYLRLAEQPGAARALSKPFELSRLGELIDELMQARDRTG